MNHRAFLVAFAIAFATAMTPADATIVLTVGNNPQPGEVNATFADQGPASTIVGDLGGSNNLSVTGTTTLASDQLISGSNVITGSGSNLVSVALSPLGGDFGFMIFDLTNATGYFDISGTDQFGNTFDFQNLVGANGHNFFTLVGVGGELLASVTVTSSGSFESLQHVAGSFAGTGGVPEPSTWAMILLGFGGIGVATRRRRGLAARMASTDPGSKAADARLM